MIILGIDPGTRVTGYGIIEQGQPLDYGAIKPPPKYDLYTRYHILYNAIDTLIRKFNPDVVVIETQFVLKNPQSALKLGMARAMAILAAKQHQRLIKEYTPSEAKRAVVGNGLASKEQVQRMVQLLLSLPVLPTPEDAADALALALCHYNHSKVPHV